MEKISSKPRKRTQKSSAMSNIEITDRELALLRKLKSESQQTYRSLVHIIEQVVALASPSVQEMSKKEYLSDPVWKLVGKASSGKPDDNSSIEHDQYLYGG